MNKNKKKISYILIIILLFSFIIVNYKTVLAYNVKDIIKNNLVKENNFYYYDKKHCKLILCGKTSFFRIKEEKNKIKIYLDNNTEINNINNDSLIIYEEGIDFKETKKDNPIILNEKQAEQFFKNKENNMKLLLCNKNGITIGYIIGLNIHEIKSNKNDFNEITIDGLSIYLNNVDYYIVN